MTQEPNEQSEAITQKEFNKHAKVLAAQIWVGFCCAMVAVGTVGVLVFGVRWENVVKQLFGLAIAVLLVFPATAAPVPKHLMKTARVQVGDRFRFKHESHYVYQVQGDLVWTHIGDAGGGVGHDYNPFTTAEVESLCNGHDLPTDRIWRRTEAVKKIYGGWGG